MSMVDATRTATSRVAVALGYQTWADGAARGHSWSPDQMVRRLCADATVAEVTVADPARHPWRLWQARAEGDRLPDTDDPRARLVRPWRLGRGEPSRRAGALRVQRRIDAHLRGVVEARDTVLVTCHPLLAAVAERDAWADVVYYGWDDWASYAPLGRGRALVEEAYAVMADRDVRVVGVTRAVVERIGAPRSTVVPNGVDAADLALAHRVPAWFADLDPTPVVFYAGSLEERVDVDSLVALAKALPDHVVVLVGPMLRPEWFVPLTALPNVLVRGVHPRQEVLSMARAAAVCLVPHRDTPLTRAMSPLKLYEYLGVGTPVVATDLEPMRGVSERCFLVPPGDPLDVAVRRASSLPPATPGELVDFRRRNGWSARYEVWREAVLG